MTTDTKALIPIEDVRKLAEAVVKSNFFTAFKTVEQSMVLMMMAQVEGCHPMQAVQRYDVIQGKPAKKADAMLADFQSRGGTVTWTEYTDEAVEAEFSSKGMAKPCKVRWTYKQATEAGLTSKPTWKQYKRQMLKARVISEGVRISDPGVVAGLYTPEEIGDFGATPPPASAPQLPASAPAEQPPVDVPSEPMASPEQVKVLAIAMTKAGIKDREDVLKWCSEKVGYPVDSRKNLTASECSKCIDAARAAESSQKSERQAGEEG